MEWKRHSIACPKVKRTFERHTRDKNGDIIRAQVTEMVHQNDIYRIVGERKPGKAGPTLWWRGANIGSV